MNFLRNLFSRFFSFIKDALKNNEIILSENTKQILQGIAQEFCDFGSAKKEKNCCLVMGLTGSGKRELIRSHSQFEGWFVLDDYSILALIEENCPVFDSMNRQSLEYFNLIQAHLNYVKYIVLFRAFQKGIAVLSCGSNLRKEDRAITISLAKEFGYFQSIVLVQYKAEDLITNKPYDQRFEDFDSSEVSSYEAPSLAEPSDVFAMNFMDYVYKPMPLDKQLILTPLELKYKQELHRI
jgi:predicted kinase